MNHWYVLNVGKIVRYFLNFQTEQKLSQWSGFFREITACNTPVSTEMIGRWKSNSSSRMFAEHHLVEFTNCMYKRLLVVNAQRDGQPDLVCNDQYRCNCRM